MKKYTIILAFLAPILLLSFTNATNSRYITKAGHINFYSHTDLEDITADNYKVVGSLDPSSGEIVFSVPMQAFEFPNATMQKHYNSSNFLNTKKYPKAKLKGTIENLSEIDFNTAGSYDARIMGQLDLHGVTKDVSELGTITVSDKGISVNAKMKLTLADYNITFSKGKPSTNIAKTIDLTIKANYEPAD